MKKILLLGHRKADLRAIELVRLQDEFGKDVELVEVKLDWTVDYAELCSIHEPDAVLLPRTVNMILFIDAAMARHLPHLQFVYNNGPGRLERIKELSMKRELYKKLMVAA